METPRSASRSRRSYPNLHNLTLAPLSAKYPLHASSPPSPDGSLPRTSTATTSYIAQKSAPATPGILSLSHSRSGSRHRSKPEYAYDGFFITPDQAVRDVGDIPKAKSTSTLHPGVSFADELPAPEKRHHARKRTAPLPVMTPLVKYHTREASDEWFHRAGLAIAEQMRDRKGQGWLVRRESSTSLVQENDDYGERPSHEARHFPHLSGELGHDPDFPTFVSPRISRAGSRIPSRIHSRVPSARQSRRSSRVGSRADLLHMSMGSKTHSAHHSLDMSELETRFIEPDFVEADEESDGDEEEVARLARERGFGLGTWMDRLIGWTLFDVDEDGETSDEDDDDDGDTNYHDQSRHGRSTPLRLENFTKEELRLRREVEAKRRKLERESIIASSALHPNDSARVAAAATSTGAAVAGVDAEHAQRLQGETAAAAPPTNEEIGGWQDAAWLLSVASKALLS